jgi:hypothetical protein
MSLPRRPRNRRPDLPDAIDRLLAGQPIENTAPNRVALTEAIWFRKYDLTEADRRRALDVLHELRRPDEEARYEAELAMHRQWRRQQ